MERNKIGTTNNLGKCVIGAILSVCFSFLFSNCGATNSPPVKLVQEPLPYAQNALEPFISASTISYHYGKHHAAYVEAANKLISEKASMGKTAEEIIAHTAGKAADVALFNNVAQAWNHAFFWKCMKPGGGGLPTGILSEKIIASFGGFDAFRKALIEGAKGRFGSGWVWLVLDGDQLKVTTTANAETPIMDGGKPLFCLDVWEHAYYLDYQNRRVEFVEKVIDNVANWDFVAERLASYTKTQK